MRPFLYSTGPESGRYLAGGTTLIDLMKLDVERPGTLIDLKATPGGKALRGIEAGSDTIRIGAMVSMAEAADDPQLKRRVPVLVQSLLLAASPQIRNMASLGGNMLQRTRCPYFRDVSWSACNKREPGSGCAAQQGYNRLHAVLGTSDECVAAYPGDFAQALMVLDAEIVTNQRSFPFHSLHKGPDTPHEETILASGERIEFISIPPGDYRRSLYLKIRDRKSYAFALASAAVVLDIDQGNIRSSRIALGGVAYQPWRATEAERTLNGQPFSEDIVQQAAEAALRDAKPLSHNAFKVSLTKNVIARALFEAHAMEI